MKKLSYIFLMMGYVMAAHTPDEQVGDVQEENINLFCGSEEIYQKEINVKDEDSLIDYMKWIYDGLGKKLVNIEKLFNYWCVRLLDLEEDYEFITTWNIEDFRIFAEFSNTTKCESGSGLTDKNLENFVKDEYTDIYDYDSTFLHWNGYFYMTVFSRNGDIYGHLFNMDSLKEVYDEAVNISKTEEDALKEFLVIGCRNSINDVIGIERIGAYFHVKEFNKFFKMNFEHDISVPKARLFKGIYDSRVLD